VIPPLASAVIAGALSTLFTGAVRPLLRRSGVVDVEGDRSAHRGVAVRGAGIGPAVALPATVAVLAILGDLPNAEAVLITATALAVAALGFVDDVRGLPVSVRLLVQLAVAVAATVGAAWTGIIPWWLVPFGIAVIVGVVNITNFMDGIDGVSSLHAMVAGATFAVVGSSLGTTWLTLIGVLIVGLFTGFLPWNVLRRGTFLGDAGSYLLGGLIGATGLLALGAGAPPAAIGGVLVIHLADTIYTLVTRIRRGEKWTESHRDHLYQRLGFERLGHARAALLVTVSTAACCCIGLLTLPQVGLSPYIAAGIFVLIGVGYLATCLRLLASRDATTEGISLDERDEPRAP